MVDVTVKEIKNAAGDFFDSLIGTTLNGKTDDYVLTEEDGYSLLIHLASVFTADTRSESAREYNTLSAFFSYTRSMMTVLYYLKNNKVLSGTFETDQPLIVKMTEKMTSNEGTAWVTFFSAASQQPGVDADTLKVLNSLPVPINKFTTALYTTARLKKIMTHPNPTTFITSLNEWVRIGIVNAKSIDGLLVFEDAPSKSNQTKPTDAIQKASDAIASLKSAITIIKARDFDGQADTLRDIQAQLQALVEKATPAAKPAAPTPADQLGPTTS